MTGEPERRAPPGTPAPRPRQLTPYNASAFQLQGVVASYDNRTPYPASLGPALASLMRPPGGAALELGCGPGNITCMLAEHATRVDAVDISSPMLAVARARCPDRRIRWLQGAAETVELEGPYALAVAGDSLHWMDWEKVLARVADALAAGARLALVSALLRPPPWADELTVVIARFSVMQDFDRYDFIEELKSRGLFLEIARTRLGPEPFTRTVDDYIDALHATAGLPRERMGGARSAQFDDEVRRLVGPHAREGVLELLAECDIVSGQPCPARPGAGCA